MLRTFRLIRKAERMYTQKNTNLHRKDFMSHTLLTFVSILYSCLGQNLGVKSFLIPLFTSYVPNPAYVADMFTVRVGFYHFKTPPMIYLGLSPLSHVFINIILSFLTFLPNVCRVSFTAEWVISFTKIPQYTI